METSALISICIPAYKRIDKVRRLLNSIQIQTYRNYEVIVSDDSPDDSLNSVLKDFPNLSVRYFKNLPALGTPANWNFAISKASGEWIKIMHDDDWFSDENSLKKFAEASQLGKKLIFSAYNNVFEEEGRSEFHQMPFSWKNKILKSPGLLLARNVIGPPSVSLIHKTISEKYEVLMKWRVDIDYYIQVLKVENDFTYLDLPLINVGISNSQVTNSCIDIPEVELPEGLLLIKKNGLMPLKNLLVYDAWWRILRNVGVRNSGQLNKYTPGEIWPEAIQQMAGFQSFIPQKILKFGPLSKILMFISYIFNSHNLSSHK